jgi:uncharacterized membrane protein YfcA
MQPGLERFYADWKRVLARPVMTQDEDDNAGWVSCHDETALKARRGLGMIADPWFYALAVPALLLTGISKGGFGAGVGVVAVPLMALRLPIAQVIAIMLPMICLADIASVWIYRGHWNRPVLWVTVPGALCGVALGTLAFGDLHGAWLRLIIGTTAIAFPFRRCFTNPRRRRAGSAHRPLQGVVWATVSGVTSVLANAGEPPLSMYMLALGLEKAILVGTTTTVFAAINLSKLLLFAMLGLFTGPSLLTSLLLSPVVLIGTTLGFWLNRHLDTAMFYRVSYALLLILGTKYLYSSLSILL